MRVTERRKNHRLTEFAILLDISSAFLGAPVTLHSPGYTMVPTITFESLDVESSFSHFRYISPGDTLQVRIWRSSSQGQGHGSKKVANAGSRNNRLRSAIFIGTRQMAPQTMRRGWSDLRLEFKLVIFILAALFKSHVAIDEMWLIMLMHDIEVCVGVQATIQVPVCNDGDDWLRRYLGDVFSCSSSSWFQQQ